MPLLSISSMQSFTTTGTFVEHILTTVVRSTPKTGREEERERDRETERERRGEETERGTERERGEETERERERERDGKEERLKRSRR